MKRKKAKTQNFILFISAVFILFIGGYIIFTNVDSNDTSKNNSTKKENKETKKEEKKEKTIVGKVPEIKLNGPSEVKIVKNGIFDDLGATAKDEEDGDLTKNVKIESKVDYKKPGNYEIIYSVTDKDNNESKITRKVTIFEVTDKNTSGIPVLMYHYFYDDINGETGEDANYLAKSLFEEQLKYLSENDYYIPNFKELEKYIDGELDLPSNSVILTLDDGAESNYRIAYPLAVQYKIPLVMFVVTSWTDVSMEFQTEMKNSGYIRFNSHTDNMHEGGCGEQHGARILCIDHDEGVTDLKTSINKLGNGDALAYPCGDTNDRAVEIVKESGMRLAFTTEYGKVYVGSDKYRLPRVRINDGNSLGYFIDSL